MRRADAEFIFRTYHSERFHSAYLRFLYLEILSEHGPYRGQEHFLSGSHIGGPADYLQKFTGTGIQFRYMQVIGIRVVIALHHFRHYHTGQPAGNLLDFLYRVHFQTYRSQSFSHFFRIKVTFEIILQPIIRYLHDIMFTLLSIDFTRRTVIT